MKRQLKNPYLYLMMLADAALLLLAHFSAYLLRFEFSLEPPQWAQFRSGLLWIILLKLLCFYFFGLYRGMWRYTSLVDLKKVFIAAVASSLIVTAFVAFLFQFQGFPRSAFLIDFVLTLLFIGGIRLGCGWC
jgi:FlaA1/EpsC-like NDP-sugar epimerase